MLQMDLPHLNVLTKIDNLASYPPLSMSLSFYTEARSLEYLLPHLQAEQGHQPLTTSGLESHESTTNQDTEETEPVTKFSALNRAIIDLVDDFGLVGFETLAVEDRQSMMQLLRTVDRAGGYAFGASEGANESVWQVAVREGGAAGTMEVRDIEERWVDRRAEFDEVERKQWAEEGRVEKGQLGNGAGKDEMDLQGEEGSAAGIVPSQDSGIKVVRKSTS